MWRAVTKFEGLPLQIGDYQVRELNQTNESLLQDLVKRCTDYYVLTDGLPPSPSAGREVLEDLPPGKSDDDKAVLGIFESSDRAIGVIDIIRDYPDAGVWYLGLMMLDSDWRSRGVGSQVYVALEQWLNSRGAQQIRLCVLTENPKGARFWRSVGFETSRTLPPKTFGNKQHVRFEMQRSLRQH